jgi:hypothetical protein
MTTRRNLKIGDRIKLNDRVESGNRVFESGHEFTIYGSSYRGWDIIDDEGNKIDECLFIHDKFELATEE